MSFFTDVRKDDIAALEQNKGPYKRGHLAGQLFTVDIGFQMISGVSG